MWPKSGDCNDFAVTKRHELLARGWTSDALLLAEVVTRWNEHHIVLVLRTQDGDFVLDNLDGDVRLRSISSYRWFRIQSPHDPRLWSTIVTKAQHDPGREHNEWFSHVALPLPSRTDAMPRKIPIPDNPRQSYAGSAKPAQPASPNRNTATNAAQVRSGIRIPTKFALNSMRTRLPALFENRRIPLTRRLQVRIGRVR